MPQWFRMYAETLHDPKVQRLHETLFKNWVNLLCLSCQHDGKLPPMPDIAFALRKTESDAKKVVDELIKNGLIDDVSGCLSPHNWCRRQYKSDLSTDRVKQFRKRERNVSATPDETPPDTETEQNRTEKKDSRASALDAFEEFWKVVPKKVAKGQAERAFKAALKACQAQTLIESMKTYAESVSGTESRFIAHPATWLNGKRWLDNQAPKSGNGSASSVDHRKKLEAMAFKIKRRMGQEYSAAYHRADLEECVKLGLITESEMLEV